MQLNTNGEETKIRVVRTYTVGVESIERCRMRAYVSSSNGAQPCGGVEGRSHWRSREPHRSKLQPHEEDVAEPKELLTYK